MPAPYHLPVFEISLIKKEPQDDGEYPNAALRLLNVFEFDSFLIAAMLISILDFAVNNVEEERQVEFENSLVDLFLDMLELRHGRIESLTIDNYKG